MNLSGGLVSKLQWGMLSYRTMTFSNGFPATRTSCRRKRSWRSKKSFRLCQRDLLAGRLPCQRHGRLLQCYDRFLFRQSLHRHHIMLRNKSVPYRAFLLHNELPRQVPLVLWPFPNRVCVQPYVSASEPPAEKQNKQEMDEEGSGDDSVLDADEHGQTELYRNDPDLVEQL